MSFTFVACVLPKETYGGGSRGAQFLSGDCWLGFSSFNTNSENKTSSQANAELLEVDKVLLVVCADKQQINLLQSLLHLHRD